MANKPLTLKQQVRRRLKRHGGLRTQAALAAQVGISPAHLSKILSGQSPRLVVAVRLENATGIPARRFAGVAQ